MSTSIDYKIVKQTEKQPEASTSGVPYDLVKDNFDKAASELNKAPISRITLILLFSLYGIVAFSKKETGVTDHDAGLLALYAIASFGFFVGIILMRDVYRSGYYRKVFPNCLIQVKRLISFLGEKSLLILFVAAFVLIIEHSDVVLRIVINLKDYFVNFVRSIIS
ncbi:MAG TPA: hypothetical protein VN420_01855 [Candidatus Fimivivens sp.]|nr:hypothetical protein [Candidatus Fimivivens sp.]